MFTGIIEEIGRIERISRSGTNSSLAISCRKILEDMKKGDSIALNGICLTVKTFDPNGFTADVMPVTLQKSNLKNSQSGDRINLERALPMQSRLGGHLVNGHIDGTGKILSITKSENANLFKIKVDREQRKFLIPQGSVCLDGISLTIAELGDEYLVVSIIPETMQNTILQYKKIGAELNMELDMIGKYLYNFMQDKEKKDISMNFLKENGFV